MARANRFVTCFILCILCLCSELADGIACPSGWSALAWDDSCSAVWPRVYVNGTAHDATKAYALSVPLSFSRAQDLCSQQNASIPTIRDLSTQLAFYKNLMGPTSGRSFWVNTWRDTRDPTVTPAKWITSRHRPDGFVFDWDTARSMPRDYDRCAAMHMKGNSALLVPGGNEKMIGVDCGSAHHVICTKKRIAPSIGAINEGEPRRIEFVWNTTDLPLRLYGARIPSGTTLTFQTSDGVNSSASYRQPTQCVGVKSVSGASLPFTLNITANVSVSAAFGAAFCGGGGTCDVGTVLIPANWPFIRGAKYSLCFFVADLFSSASTLEEYENNLLGENMVIDVVQKYTSYENDICEQRYNDIASFYRGYTDRTAPRRTLNPFDSSVENSWDSLLSYSALNPPKGYEGV